MKESIFIYKIDILKMTNEMKNELKDWKHLILYNKKWMKRKRKYKILSLKNKEREGKLI